MVTCGRRKGILLIIQLKYNVAKSNKKALRQMHREWAWAGRLEAWSCGRWQHDTLAPQQGKIKGHWCPGLWRSPMRAPLWTSRQVLQRRHSFVPICTVSSKHSKIKRVTKKISHARDIYRRLLWSHWLYTHIGPQDWPLILKNLIDPNGRNLFQFHVCSVVQQERRFKIECNSWTLRKHLG